MRTSKDVRTFTSHVYLSRFSFAFQLEINFGRFHEEKTF